MANPPPPINELRSQRRPSTLTHTVIEGAKIEEKVREEQGRGVRKKNEGILTQTGCLGDEGQESEPGRACFGPVWVSYRESYMISW